MKQTEKMLVGVVMLAGGIALIAMVGLPQWDAFNQSNDKLNTLKTDITGGEAKKLSMQAELKLLEKNTNVPRDIYIRTYTPDTKEKVIKSLLGQLVDIATQTGNQFISLAPATVDPILTHKGNSETKDKDTAKDSGNGDSGNADAAANPDGESANPDGEKDASKAKSDNPPLIDTFGYDLSIRGTYDTIQTFLKNMSTEKELMEISVIRLENESLSKSDNKGNKPTDPLFPIRLTATVRLGIQPRPSSEAK